MKFLLSLLFISSQVFAQDSANYMYLHFTPGTQLSGYQQDEFDMGNSRLFKIDISGFNTDSEFGCEFTTTAKIHGEHVRSENFNDTVLLLLYGSDYEGHIISHVSSEYNSAPIFNRIAGSALSTTSQINTSINSHYLVGASTRSSEQGSSAGSHSSLVIGSKSMMVDMDEESIVELGLNSIKYSFIDEQNTDIEYTVEVECE